MLRYSICSFANSTDTRNGNVHIKVVVMVILYQKDDTKYSIHFFMTCLIYCQTSRFIDKNIEMIWISINSHTHQKICSKVGICLKKFKLASEWWWIQVKKRIQNLTDLYCEKRANDGYGKDQLQNGSSVLHFFFGNLIAWEKIGPHNQRRRRSSSTKKSIAFKKKPKNYDKWRRIWEDGETINSDFEAFFVQMKLNNPKKR